MRAVVHFALSFLLVTGLVGCSGTQAGVEQPSAKRTVKTTQAQGDFRFAVIGDRTGAHRPGVFSDAMRKLELLQPDFVITVGDLLEGYTKDEQEIVRQWEEVEQRLSVLSMPVYHIAGNHDYSNTAMARIWKERRGAAYWAFVYEQVLFIGLCTEDPPVPQSARTLASTRELEAAMARAPEQTQSRLLEAVKARGQPPKLPGAVNISADQVEFVRQTLLMHRDARWTFLVMHKPAWQYDSQPFYAIEAMLADRPYTVIAGHEHYYEHETRRGRDYIVMGTTGGVWLRDGPGRVDHFAMVSMKDAKPIIANVRTDGVFPKEGQSVPTLIPEGGDVSSGQ